MKKSLPYLISFLGLLLIIFFFLGKTQKKTINTNISLSKNSKDPYGAYVFYESLKSFFPKSKQIINYNAPDDPKTFSIKDSNQLYVILRANFFPSKIELDDLFNFIDRGNQVFISTLTVSELFESNIRATINSKNAVYFPNGNYGENGMKTSLNSPPFTQAVSYNYPGVLIESGFSEIDSSIAQVLGRNSQGEPNFIKLKKGKGHLYIQVSPLCFSNYFLLYKNNRQYFENLFSNFSADSPAIIWDEYFSSYQHQQSSADWFSEIMKNKFFRTGILIALLLIFIYAITEMRRKQRVIPILPRPENSSLDFVRTVGLLYYEKGDHANLARKISAHFLDHVRSKYKIFTQKLNAEFTNELSYKSGVNEGIVSEIVRQLQQLQSEGFISETELIILQKNIEDFHSNE